MKSRMELCLSLIWLLISDRVISLLLLFFTKPLLHQLTNVLWGMTYNFVKSIVFHLPPVITFLMTSNVILITLVGIFGILNMLLSFFFSYYDCVFDLTKLLQNLMQRHGSWVVCVLPGDVPWWTVEENSLGLPWRHYRSSKGFCLRRHHVLAPTIPSSQQVSAWE